jgi:hypothetical protein
MLTPEAQSVLDRCLNRRHARKRPPSVKRTPTRTYKTDAGSQTDFKSFYDDDIAHKRQRIGDSKNMSRNVVSASNRQKLLLQNFDNDLNL